MSKHVYLIGSILVLSSCASPMERRISYEETVKRFSDDELCFQWVAHDESDRWQDIRYEEIARRTRSGSPPDCKSWIEAARTSEERNPSSFKVPSFYTPNVSSNNDSALTQEQLSEALNNQTREIRRQQTNYDLINNWKPLGSNYQSAPTRQYKPIRSQ